MSADVSILADCNSMFMDPIYVYALAETLASSKSIINMTKKERFQKQLQWKIFGILRFLYESTNITVLEWHYYIHTYMHTYIHTYIYTHINTYIQTYIHT